MSVLQEAASSPDLLRHVLTKGANVSNNVDVSLCPPISFLSAPENRTDNNQNQLLLLRIACTSEGLADSAYALMDNDRRCSNLQNSPCVQPFENLDNMPQTLGNLDFPHNPGIFENPTRFENSPMIANGVIDLPRNENVLPATSRNGQFQNNQTGASRDLIGRLALSNFQLSSTGCLDKSSLTARGQQQCSNNNLDDCFYRPSTTNNFSVRRTSLNLRRTEQRISNHLGNVRFKDIEFGELIGKGAFGLVHSGYVKGRPVAVKVVQKRRGSGVHREILQAERLAFSMNLQHENIISILAVNLSDGLRGDALIVMELVTPHKTLQCWLDDLCLTLTTTQRLLFALQIARALRYLHANHVAHLDVKPRNLLLTPDNICKLADFGSLTRTRQDAPKEDLEYTQLLGTLPYRAPELMKGDYPSCKADIFSLGITLWQLVTRETPHSGANPHWLIYQVTKGNRRPELHHAGSDTLEVRYRDLYTACWAADPESRPPACDVITTLNRMHACVLEGK